MRKEKIYELWNNFKDKYDSIMDETEYWIAICNELKMEQVINEYEYSIVMSILESEEYTNIFIDSPINTEKKLEILKLLLIKFYNHAQTYCEKDNIKHKLFGVIETPKEQEIYITKIFDSTYVYLLIYQIYNSKYSKLIDKVEQNAFHRCYGDSTVLDGHYYCPSVIGDLISNGRCGKLLKRVPKDTNDKIEYIYDKNGNLIMWRKMLVGKPMIYGEFFLYAKSFVVRLLFEKHDDEYNIANISVSEYVEEYISQYMSVHFYVNPWKNNEDAYGLKQEVRCLECVHEKYIYSEGKLTEGEYLRYHFPRVDYIKNENDRYGFKGVLICNLYEFKYDDESRIEGFYGGDLTNRLLNMDCFYKLDKSKKESTRKESGRWKRPNYYIEM